MFLVVVALLAQSPLALSSTAFVLQLVIIISMLHDSSCCCIASPVLSLRSSRATHLPNLKRKQGRTKKLIGSFTTFMRVWSIVRPRQSLSKSVFKFEQFFF